MHPPNFGVPEILISITIIKQNVVSDAKQSEKQALGFTHQHLKDKNINVDNNNYVKRWGLVCVAHLKDPENIEEENFAIVGSDTDTMQTGNRKKMMSGLFGLQMGTGMHKSMSLRAITILN